MGLADPAKFAACLTPFRKSEWVVYAKPPSVGPEAVLAYLSRYTHRVAISNHRLVSVEVGTVAFRWKDCRIKQGDRQKVMRLATDEFIRRFLIHVLPPSRQIFFANRLLGNGRLPPHPALRPAGKCQSQGQHREDLHPARGATTRLGTRNGA